ncbi:DNA replication factor C, large subunit [Rozella allomycis CSF55]|uniref:Replication factor C subunit 1 n=1 Tax=Rozella allomycis (strain CSF55) TaxID=988480 RepID=A0A4P9YMZ0_ROZAC|nr:DNA replication factor C, large subunit [Rozella allomycis CSF55]
MGRSKDEIKQIITNNGGRVLANVGKTADFYLTNKPVSIARKEKLDQLEIKVMNDENFALILKERMNEKSEEKLHSFETSYYEYKKKLEAPKVEGIAMEIPECADNCMSGMTFVLTGNYCSLTREEAEDLIKRYGGRVTSAPSRKTSYLVVGSEPGQTKLAKAQALNLKCINEEEFFNLIKSLPGKERQLNEWESKMQESSQANTIERIPNSSQLNSQNMIASQSATVLNGNTQNSSQIDSQMSVVDGNDFQLLTDKYKPKKIKDLVGNKSNVDKLVNWLKGWTSSTPQKAVLISGPPGIGKTSSVFVVASELNYSIIEFNASDTRSKKSLEATVKHLIDNKSLNQFFKGETTQQTKEKKLILMDEVDGMSSGDRGGMQELIQIIKKTKTPIICICNDRSSQKVRSLANYCLDLRFKRPDANQIRSRIMMISFREGLKIDSASVDQLVAGTQSDIRQIINTISTWKTTQSSMGYDQAKKLTTENKKNVEFSLFDLTGQLFSHQSKSISDRLELYFYDYSFVPLMIQENYIKSFTSSDPLENTLKAADSIADADIVDGMIHGTTQNWSLAPLHGILSSVKPCHHIKGRLQGRLDFSSWLGMNSKSLKYQRILKDLALHLSLNVSADSSQLRLVYLQALSSKLYSQLLNFNNVEETIKILDDYYLTKEDFDVLPEFLLRPAPTLSTQMKSSLTRTYNKSIHKTPYSLYTTSKKALPVEKKSLIDDEAENEDVDEIEDESISENEDVSKDKMFQQKKSKAKPKKK